MKVVKKEESEEKTKCNPEMIQDLKNYKDMLKI